MKRILSIALAVSIGLNLGLLFTQYQGNKGPEGGPGPRHGRQGQSPGQLPPNQQDPGAMIETHVQGLTQHVGLNNEQQARLRLSLEANIPRLLAAQRQGQIANEAVSRAFARPAFDEIEFRRVVMDASLARGRVDSLSGIMLLEEASILDTEQRSEYAKVAPTIHTRGGATNNRPPPPPPR